MWDNVLVKVRYGFQSSTEKTLWKGTTHNGINFVYHKVRKIEINIIKETVELVIHMLK